MSDTKQNKLNKYFLREGKKIDYKTYNNKRDDGIEYDDYDTDEELKKLDRMEQQYPGLGTDEYEDSDEDCDLNQDDNHNNNGNNDNTGIEKHSEQENKNDICDENGICNDWDFEQLMGNKTFLFNCKYRWNFCSTYFKEENLEHIYSASWPKPIKQQINKYNLMLKECIETVIKYHSKTMDNELIKQFNDFPNKYRIQFYDEILLFNGMTEGKELTNEKGRSIRIGFFKDDELKMIVCYADNKQFVAECQQFFGLKIGDFEYCSRKWMLSEDPAWTDTKGNIILNQKWIDIGLILGISIINRLLNPSLPSKHRINSIYRQTIFDVTDLLPPFDDLKSLLKNDNIWWTELEKRLNREQQKSKTPSEMSSYQGSLKDFIDDTIKESPIDIQRALHGFIVDDNINNIDNDRFNKSNHKGMMSTFLKNIQQYNEEKDADYFDHYDQDNDDDDDDDNDYEKYVDDDINEDFIKLFGAKSDNDNHGDHNNHNNHNNHNKKRKFNEIRDNDTNACSPTPKKQKMEKDPLH